VFQQTVTGAPLIERRELADRVRAAVERGSIGLVAGAGYGKTVLVEQALEGRTTAWMSCRFRDLEVDRLLVDALQAIRRAVPGAADVLLESVGAGGAPLSPIGLTRAMLDELEALLVEPLVFVLDDAEQLAEARPVLDLLEQLLETEHERIRFVLCTRRPLPLRVARAQATGRVSIINESELAFSAEETAALLAMQLGRTPTDDEVTDTMQATLGWPLGVALGASIGNPTGGIARFLAEEVLAGLDPELRSAMLASSAVEEITPAMAEALDLPSDLGYRLGRLGVLLRPVAGRPDAIAYHPLLRDHLRETWEGEVDPATRASVLSRAAAQLMREGRTTQAIDAWLAAGQPEPALDAIYAQAIGLVRTSQRGVQAWLSLLPPEVADDPRAAAVAGRLAATEGRHEDAVALLRRAAEALAPDEASPAATVAAESLYWLGRVPDGLQLLESLERPDAAAQTWRSVLLGSSGRLEEAAAQLQRVERLPDATMAAGLRALAEFYIGLPDGRHDEIVQLLRRRLEALSDDHRAAHRPEYLAAFVAFTLADSGRPDEAVGWTDVLLAEASRSGLPSFVTAETHALRAWLLASAGREAEAELALGAIRELPPPDGWAPGIAESAMAACLLARGERAAAQALAEQARAHVATAPLPFRNIIELMVIRVLAEATSPARGIDQATQTLAWLTETYGEAHGSHHRARALALRAWARSLAGDLEGAGADLRDALEVAGTGAPAVLRVEWPRIADLVTELLARDLLDPAVTLGAAERAFPGGQELIDFAEHPSAPVRALAARSLGSSGHPRAEALLEALCADDDPQVAAAAHAARAAGRRSPPPRTFTLFGAFSLRRGDWPVDERAWGRPTTARLVRVLLAQRGAFLPEEALTEALWPDKPPKSARASVQVAVSRARAVIDGPNAEQSAIQYSERAYRLVLDGRDRVDTELFAAAAEAALADTGPARLRLLEHAASLWLGEPMPEERYSDWAAEWREDLTATYQRVLWSLAELRGRAGDHAGAAAAAGRLVALDPLDEGAQRLLIAAHARAGNRARALRQYLACRKELIDTLGLEPAEETRALQRRVLAGQPV
jgi:ATP/maltotriose-dependent transcriptional regulator MalT/DNA-binding SARP family transcriptional activator